MHLRTLLMAWLASGLLAATLVAAETSPTNAPAPATPAPAREPGKEPAKDKAKSKEPEEKLVQSRHTATIGGQRLNYAATAGTIQLRDEDDKPTASIFYIAYTLNHLNVDPALLDNLTLDTYTAGHMMYLNLPDLRKSKTDLARFIRSGLPPGK